MFGLDRPLIFRFLQIHVQLSSLFIRKTTHYALSCDGNATLQLGVAVPMHRFCSEKSSLLLFVVTVV